jgi:hypothetical protein
VLGDWLHAAQPLDAGGLGQTQQKRLSLVICQHNKSCRLEACVAFVMLTA